MGENIKELLNEEIAAEIQAISSLDSGSEKKSTGTYTSTTFRGLFNRFRPTKK